MTSGHNRLVETVDAGTHTYVITENKVGNSTRFRVDVSGQAGTYCVEHLFDLTWSREIGAALPAPVPELDGARLVAGRRNGVWYFYAPSKEHAGALEDGKIYAAQDLAPLVPTAGMPMPDLLIAARDESDNFDAAIVAEFGRIMTTYGINLSDDTYYDRGLYFLENEAEIIDDEAGMDAIAARAGYDSYTQFQYDDAGESVLSRSPYEVEKMEWIDRIGLAPQMVVDFVLESSEKTRDDTLGVLFREYRNSGMQEVHFEGGRRTAEEIRAAVTSDGPTV
jgi:hypothetical protein